MPDSSALTVPTPLRPRRNPRLLVSGVIAICLGGLGSAALYISVTDARSVVRTNRTIYRGEVIQAADLGVTSVGGTLGVRTVPAERVGELIGRTALTDLPGGSLFPPDSVGPAEVPPGSSRIGLKLAPGRVPVSPLPAGTPVLLVAVPKDSAAQAGTASVPG